MASPNQNNSMAKRITGWMMDNVVTVVFVVFIIIGFIVSKDMPLAFFLSDLSSRFFRNAFLVLSLIIPVVAGLGLNFGIIVGAMAAQIALIIVRYFNLGGISGLLLTALIAAPLALLFGWLTGKLYNKTKGQEMIASLMVGYFATGVYLFLMLFVVGVIIPVPADHPLIKPDGVGVRMTVDLVSYKDGGLKYSLDSILQIPFTTTLILIGIAMIAYLVIQFVRSRNNPAVKKPNLMVYVLSGATAIAITVMGIVGMVTKNSLSMVGKTPVVTLLVIAALCLFTAFIMKTKLGQDFRSVGQSQHIAEISGINVDRTRIIATVMSTVLAAWGHIIYMQNMGTLATYDTHRNIGMFSVAALLVGGASTSKASIKQALIGTLLFNAMFIMSPEIGQAVFGQGLLGEYFRTFMVYGVIGVALGLYAWKALKRSKQTIE